METLESLICRAQQGDLNAFGSIVQRFQDMAVGYAYSVLGDFHLAEDAAQEAFLEAYRDLSKVYGATAFPGWLRKIVFKFCDRLTRRKRIGTCPLEDALGNPGPEQDPARLAEERELKDTVLTAIRALPDEERAVTMLFYIDGYSYNEIASFLEMPATTVDNRLRASRKRLRQSILPMVEETLHHQQPSTDRKFANRVQLFNAAEVDVMDKVQELLSQDVTQVALYEFLKAHAREEQVSVEELVVRLLRQYRAQIERQTGVFRAKVDSQEKREALRQVEAFYQAARFHQGAILEIASLIPQANHNVPVITRIAYLASVFGYHTGPLVTFAKMATGLNHDCLELSEIAEIVVLKRSDTQKVVVLAQDAIVAQSGEEKRDIRTRIEALRATADCGSVEEALASFGTEDQQREQEERDLQATIKKANALTGGSGNAS